MSNVAGPSELEDLRAEVRAAGAGWSQCQYRLVSLARRLDSSGQWVAEETRTCAHWIAQALDIEVCTAREWVRIGHMLTALDLIDAAFAEGRLSYSKVRALTRVANVDNQAELLGIAMEVPAGRLATALAAWLTRSETPEETEARQRESRTVWWRTSPDGMITGGFRLPPWDATAVTSAIDAMVMSRQAGLGTGRRAAGAPAANGTSSWPSMAQQRADSLRDLVAGGGADVEAEVVLHVRGDGCTLDDGTPIAGSLVERIAGDAFLRVLIHDAESRPINASARQRHPTARQRRVVRERDRVCVDCGGDGPFEWDHEPPFGVTGRTLVDELRLRCRPCHRARHAAPQQG